jgi:hypothetical protein
VPMDVCHLLLGRP